MVLRLALQHRGADRGRSVNIMIFTSPIGVLAAAIIAALVAVVFIYNIRKELR
jgi:hypothetical protein